MIISQLKNEEQPESAGHWRQPAGRGCCQVDSVWERRLKAPVGPPGLHIPHTDQEDCTHPMQDCNLVGQQVKACNGWTEKVFWYQFPSICANWPWSLLNINPLTQKAHARNKTHTGRHAWWNWKISTSRKCRRHHAEILMMKQSAPS